MSSMLQKWDILAPREKGLLGLLGLIILCLLIWYAVVAPINKAKAAAEAGYRAAQRDTREVEAATLQAKALNAQQDTATRSQSADTSGQGQDIRQIISQSTRKVGLTLSRLQPDATTGGLTIWLDDVDAQTLLRWIKDIYEDHGISAQRVSLQRGDGTAIRAQLLLLRNA